jgi:hypothetical protein
VTVAPVPVPELLPPPSLPLLSSLLPPHAVSVSASAPAMTVAAVLAALCVRMVLLVLRITAPFFVPRRTFELLSVRSGLRGELRGGKSACTVNRPIVITS